MSAAVQTQSPILIVDPSGLLGEHLALRLQSAFNPFLVCKKNISTGIVRTLSYHTDIPQIPDALYSHIVVVLDGNQSTEELLLGFLNKARQDNARLVIISSVDNFRKNVMESMTSSYRNAYAVVVGDIYHADKSLPETRIDHLLYQAQHEEKVTLSGMGMAKLFPVGFEEILEKIEFILTQEHHGFKTFFLLQKHAPTELRFIHELQKKEPLLKIDFSPVVEKIERGVGDSEGTYFLENDNGWKKDLELLFAVKRSKKPSQAQRISSTKNNKTRGVSKKGILFLAGGFLFLILLPWFATLAFFILGSRELQQAYASLNNGDLSSAQRSARHVVTFVDYAKRSSSFMAEELALIGQKEHAQAIMVYSGVGEKLSLAFYESVHAGNRLQHILDGTTPNPSEELARVMSSARKAVSYYQQAKVDMRILPDNPFVKKHISHYILLMQDKDTEAAISFVSSLIDMAPKILGFDSKKTYLFLFQNNMELRPGGGFIGSYGLLSLEKGRIQDFTIHDVYDADGQLKGHIEPPFAIRRYMPSAHWYLRDSNFNPDFSQGASMSAFFLQQETGESADGVIGVDVSFVKKLIEAVGEVKVEEYNETVNVDNFYLITQKHAEKDFFPGSRQKKDFLRSLLLALQTAVFVDKKVSYLSLAKVVEESLFEKHVLAAVADPVMQSVLTTHGFSSSLRDTREQKDNTINDFLGVSEANLGVNKSNFFIKRKIAYDVDIDKTGSIFAKTTLYYKNTSSGWPGGDYKNYVRVIVPEGSTLASIIIDGEEQAIRTAIIDPLLYEKTTFKAPSELEIERVEQQGKTLYGFLVMIPQGALKTITISYTLPQKIVFDNPVLHYSLRLFKQPGTEDDPVSVVVTYPDSLKLVKKSENVEDKKDRIMYNSQLLRDTLIEAEFIKR